MSWRMVAGILVFGALSLIATAAFAQPCPPVDVNLTMEQAADTQEWWMVLLSFLVQIVSPLLETVLVVLGGWLIRKLSRKWSDDKQHAALSIYNRIVKDAVAFSEEQTRKALRSDGVKTESAEKLQVAVDYVEARVGEAGLDTLAQDAIRDLLEARLHKERTKPDGVIPSDPPVPAPALVSSDE